MREDEMYHDLAELLHVVWQRVKWQNFSTSWKRRQTDIFQHRLKKASASRNVNQVIERLCKGLSIQSIEPEPALIDRIQRDEERALSILRKESVVLTLLAKQGREVLGERPEGEATTEGSESE